MPSYKGKAKKPKLNWRNNYATRNHDVKLPTHMKCFRCCKVKAANDVNFSNYVLSQAKDWIAENGEATRDELTGRGGKDAPFACITCSSRLDHDLQCAECSEFKQLSDFSKVQRRRGEEAECKMCVNRRMGLLPDVPDECFDKEFQLAAEAEEPEEDAQEEEMISGIGTVSVNSDVKSEGGVSLSGWVESSVRSYALHSTNTSQSAASRLTFNPKLYGSPSRSVATAPMANSSRSTERQNSKWSKTFNANSQTEKPDLPSDDELGIPAQLPLRTRVETYSDDSDDDYN